MNDAAGRRQAALQQRLEQLSAQFLRRTTRETIVISERLTQLRQGDLGALEPLRQLTHKIHGTAATLGFPSIGQRAAELERLCEEYPAGSSPVPQSVELLAQIAARLEKEVARAVANLPKAVQGP